MRVDKPMNILNKKHKIVIGALSIITVFLTVFLVYAGIQKINEMTRTPFLKITTRSRVSWLSSGKDYYYILYDNGNLEETEMFYQSDVESYDLYMYENGKQSGEGTDQNDSPPYADEIIEITENMGTSYLTGKLFVLDSKYYFSAYDGGKHIDSLYEYFPQDGSVKKLVSTKRNEEIQYIEAY